jgi:hypothetical protein
MEVYESHLGGIYFSEDVLDWDELYCDECGDSDTHLGHANTWEEVISMLKWGWEEDDEFKYDQEYVNDLKKEFEILINNE